MFRIHTMTISSTVFIILLIFGQNVWAQNADSEIKTATINSHIHTKISKTAIAPTPLTKTVSVQPKINESENVHSDDVPQSDSQFDYARRVIEFAILRRDQVAINDLKLKLPKMNELSSAEKKQIKKMLASFETKYLEIENKDLLITTVNEHMKQKDAVSLVSPFGAREKFALPNAAASLFSEDYLRIRKRYFDFFFFEGMSASELHVMADDGNIDLSEQSVTLAWFSDQTLHMGQAMLTFASEARLLQSRGIAYDSSEAVISKLLEAFDLTEATDKKLYGASKAGFFGRDIIHNDDRYGVPDSWAIISDMNTALKGTGTKWQNAMSIDQTVSLFVGWWAISKWSTSQDNIAKARKQIDTVMNFLIESKFLIRLPNGDSIGLDRGPDFRYAAGFLCNIAEEVTGKNYFSKAKIDITIKGNPIHFKDNNLGEFKIPKYRIPASLPVYLSHAAILKLGPYALTAMTLPPKIHIPFSKLFPGADKSIKLPCLHFEQIHPDGDKVKIPCVHRTAKHPAGDPGPDIPCIHLVGLHPKGHKTPCLHITAKHPAGDPGPTITCLHKKQKHKYDSYSEFGIKVKVPCTHLVKIHPNDHPTKIPCIHTTPKHPNNHKIDCWHMTAKHPDGDKTKIPCIHLVKKHPDGHVITSPCIHAKKSHPAGHVFDLTKLDIEIPLGEKIHSYARHIALQCFAFEPTIVGANQFLPPALQSNHIWSVALRTLARGDIPTKLFANQAKNDHKSIPKIDGPNNLVGGPWVKNNRWVWSTSLEAEKKGSIAYNGLDFLSFENLLHLLKVLD